MCEGEIMDTETHEISERTASGKSRRPLDVRIVAYFSYFVALAHVPLGIIFCCGATKLVGSYPVLFGVLVIANEAAAGVYKLLTGLCWLFCGWGLLRGATFTWWFAMIFSVYYLTDEALQFSRSPRDFAIGATIQILLVVWLWFRRELYDVHLGLRGTGT
jgi:hypothetical protein